VEPLKRSTDWLCSGLGRSEETLSYKITGGKPPSRGKLSKRLRENRETRPVKERGTGTSPFSLFRERIKVVTYERGWERGNGVSPMEERQLQ